MKRTICVITGTRADYGILYPVMRAIQSSSRLSLSCIVTGMHLMPAFGYTVKEIRKDGFPVDYCIDVTTAGDTARAMASSAGKLLSRLSDVLAQHRPDILLLLGDRSEMLVSAVAANCLQIPVAHIHGGERSGHIDEVFRHAITKLAHIHFPATRTSALRIRRLGEDPRRIFTAGAPALDRILSDDYMSAEEIVSVYGIEPGTQYLMVVQHPTAVDAGSAAEHVRTTMDAVTASALPAVVIYPNADPGGRSIIGALRAYRSRPGVQIHKSLPHRDYLGLMRHAAALVGNSSSGIIEAPSFHVPVINIGGRQAGRERGANVIDVPYDKQQILAGIRRALNDVALRKRIRSARNPYGMGTAGRKIAQVLETIPLNSGLLDKQITY